MKIKIPTFPPPFLKNISQSSTINSHDNSSVKKKNFGSMLRQNSLSIEKLEIDLSERQNYHAPWWSQTLKSSVISEQSGTQFKDPSTIAINSIKLTDILKAVSTSNNHLKTKLI